MTTTTIERHGYVRYSHGCRCDICRASKAAYIRQYRAARRGFAPSRHGRSGYEDYGCRCATCRRAKGCVS